MAAKELTEALKVLVERLTPEAALTRQKSWLPEWANSPFVVTVLGGLLISMATVIFQLLQARISQTSADRAAVLEKARQKFQQDIDARKTVSLAFINGFPGALWRLRNYVDCNDWVQANKPGSIQTSTGLSYKDMWNRMVTLNETRLNSTLVDTFPQQISITFRGQEVLGLTSNLDTALGNLSEATNYQTLHQAFTNVNDLYIKVVSAMRAEIENEQQKEMNEYTSRK